MSENELPFDLSDYSFDTERFDMSGCEVETRGRVSYPFEGAAIWVASLPVPLSLVSGAQGLMSKDTGAFERIRNALSKVICGHTMRDPATGDYYPQVWGKPDAVEEWPVEALWEAISYINTGEAPKDRPNVSTRGQRGSSTRKSTATKTGA